MLSSTAEVGSLRGQAFPETPKMQYLMIPLTLPLLDLFDSST